MIVTLQQVIAITDRDHQRRLVTNSRMPPPVDVHLLMLHEKRPYTHRASSPCNLILVINNRPPSSVVTRHPITSRQTSPTDLLLQLQQIATPTPSPPLRPAYSTVAVGLVCTAADGREWSRSLRFLIARDRRVLPAIWSRSNADRGKPYYKVSLVVAFYHHSNKDYNRNMSKDAALTVVQNVYNFCHNN